MPQSLLLRQHVIRWCLFFILSLSLCDILWHYVLISCSPNNECIRMNDRVNEKANMSLAVWTQYRQSWCWAVSQAVDSRLWDRGARLHGCDSTPLQPTSDETASSLLARSSARERPGDLKHKQTPATWHWWLERHSLECKRPACVVQS